MKKPDLLIPTKPLVPGESMPLNGKTPSPHFMGVDWYALAKKRFPDIKLTFEKKCHEDWLLYGQIEILAEQLEVDYVDAAAWGLRRALGNGLEPAREMAAQKITWDVDTLYVCTIFGLQLCRFIYPKKTPSPDMIMHMIDTLLVSDEELLMQAPAKNQQPC